MKTDLTTLAVAVDEAVRGVPGVTAVYGASSSLARSARLALPGAESPLCEVSETDEGISVLVSVGVSPDIQAPATALTVARAVRSVVGPSIEADVRVRVSRITE